MLKIHIVFCDERIFVNHAMGDFKGLPVFVRYEAGLDQEAVDQTESHREHRDTDPKHTCRVQQLVYSRGDSIRSLPL